MSIRDAAVRVTGMLFRPGVGGPSVRRDASNGSLPGHLPEVVTGGQAR